MIYIAHRGNIRGPNPKRENSPDYIDEAIQSGYYAEVDVRMDAIPGRFAMGHDYGTHILTHQWFEERRGHLFIHAKDLATYAYFIYDTLKWNVFWHQRDAYTLTSGGQIWAYPGSVLNEKCICVMPESVSYSREQLSQCAGICSDIVESYQREYGT